MIILEYCEHGNLSTFIESHGPLSINDFKKIAYQCLTAVNAMHETGIVHLDIKPENIFLTENYRVKIADFGLASLANPSTKIRDFKGSYMYMSPERFTGEFFDPVKADIWSLGVTFYYLLTGVIPWNSTSQSALIKSISNSSVMFPNRIDASVERMIMNMLDKDP